MPKMATKVSITNDLFLIYCKTKISHLERILCHHALRDTICYYFVRKTLFLCLKF